MFSLMPSIRVLGLINVVSSGSEFIKFMFNYCWDEEPYRIIFGLAHEVQEYVMAYGKVENYSCGVTNEL